MTSCAWVSDAQVAEALYTAFTSKKRQAVTARLIVRRVRDLNNKAAAGQDELFPLWRYHAVFTDSPFELAIFSRFSGVQHVVDGPSSRVVDTVIWSGYPRRAPSSVTHVTCASPLVAAAFCSASRARSLRMDMSMTQNRRSSHDQAEG
jgi:hypothetical protein